jgi:hypothetical protein
MVAVLYCSLYNNAHNMSAFKLASDSRGAGDGSHYGFTRRRTRTPEPHEGGGEVLERMHEP